MSKRVLIWLSLSSLALSGCVADKKRDLEAERQRLAQYVLAEAPKDLENKLAVSFEGKVSLIGYDVSPSKRVKPGGSVKLKMYWRLDKDLEPGWSLFTHVLDSSGQRLLNIDNVGPLREWRGDSQALPPGDWEVGKVYVDEQTFVVPKGATTGDVKVVVGVWKKEERLKVTQGQADTENRALVVSLDLSDGKKKAKRSSKKSDRAPRLRVQMLDDDQTITIDGKLDEKAWRRAAATRRFVNVQTGSSNTQFPVNGRAKLLWDEKFLYVAFEVEDKDITGGFAKGAKDPHLWTKDTVEIMVDPDGDGDNKDYYEIQISPQNLVFDSRFDDYNVPQGSDTAPYGHEDWSSGLESAVVIDGSIDNPKDEDKGYVVEARIPWKAFDKAQKVPPDPGSTWRMNFYAMQDNGGVAWSPIMGKGNFHKASRFGRVTWTKVDRRIGTKKLREGAGLNKRLSKLKGALGSEGDGERRKVPLRPPPGAPPVLKKDPSEDP